ncbi:hypothetical protein KIN20_001830 [Parelaphostrongylus tenuis]|uniref:Uncharacterized protein n=1 Tax=Parelaphostrongylus tenuis TaxID=148309 RepID=A0AAD5QCK8_PARTN|nr:hypothetical protein KIN20_001830 [Parelaphostrongylus tenuis]
MKPSLVVNSSSHSRNEIVASEDLTSGKFVNIIPALFDSGEYTLYYGMGCEGSSCPNKMKFTVRPNTVSILWVVPQFIVITLGEVLLSVTGLEFAYSQSAPSVKSLLQVGHHTIILRRRPLL